MRGVYYRLAAPPAALNCIIYVQPWIGVGRAGLAVPPPSEPDRRFSRIRLSSRWSYLRED